MQEYVCILYETAGGKKPVEEFIESLESETQDKFIIKQRLLQDFGPQLRHPHTDNIGEGIFELRFKGKEGQQRDRNSPREKERFFNEKQLRRPKTMKKVDDYIKEKLKKNPDFKARYNLLTEKATVVKKIIEYRLRHKLSQEQLAEGIGVTQQYISKIEEGEFSNLDAIENILEHIGYRLKLEVIPA